MSTALFSGRVVDPQHRRLPLLPRRVRRPAGHLPAQVVKLASQVERDLVLLLAELAERHPLAADLDRHLFALAARPQQARHRPGEQHQAEQHDRGPGQVRDGGQELRHGAMMAVRSGRVPVAPPGTVGGSS